jgi:hypothetical protein
MATEFIGDAAAGFASFGLMEIRIGIPNGTAYAAKVRCPRDP